MKPINTLGSSGFNGYVRPMSDIIYRLMDQRTWQSASDCGVFEGSADDRRDGFIHFSTAKTVRETARRYYGDVADLLLLSIAADDLGEDLKWEPSRGGILFPHLYASLPMALVRETASLEHKNTGHVFGAQFP